MNLKSDPEHDDDNYYPIAAVSSIAQDQITLVHLKGQAIILTSLEGSLHAFSASCPHAAGNLAAGELYRGRIDCPDHGYRFDIRSGRPLWPQDELCRLRIFAVKIEDDQVLIRL